MSINSNPEYIYNPATINQTMDEVKNAYADMLILQYRNKPKARATVKLGCDIYSGNGLLLRLFDLLDIDTTGDFGLYLIGKILDAPRNIPGAGNEQEYFAFDNIEISGTYTAAQSITRYIVPYLSNFTSITSGSLHIVYNGNDIYADNIQFSENAQAADIAAAINAAIENEGITATNDVGKIVFSTPEYTQEGATLSIAPYNRDLPTGAVDLYGSDYLDGATQTLITPDYETTSTSYGVGFSTLDTLRAGKFKTIADLQNATYTLPLEDYRTLLKFKAIFNRWHASWYDMDKALYDSFGNKVNLINTKDLSITFAISSDLKTPIKAAFILGYLKAPIAIGLNYVISVAIPTKIFGFRRLDVQFNYASGFSTLDKPNEGTFLNHENLVLPKNL